MRQTDLELYRWNWHNEVYLQFKRVQEAKRQMRPSSYWKEYGAFVSVLPRQTGKTTMIKTMIDVVQKGNESANTNYVVICPTGVMAANFVQTTGAMSGQVLDIDLWGAVTRLSTTPMPPTHLFVDEFNYIDYSKLDSLLDNNWLSVSMVSTLR